VPPARRKMSPHHANGRELLKENEFSADLIDAIGPAETPARISRRRLLSIARLRQSPGQANRIGYSGTMPIRTRGRNSPTEFIGMRA